MAWSSRAGTGHEGLERVRFGEGVADRVSDVERGHSRVLGRAVEGSDVLHVDSLDLPHLGDEQVDDGLVGQVDDQFVHGSTCAPLDDVDADDIASHRTDPGRNCTQRTRTVGQPHAEYMDRHGHGPYRRTSWALGPSCDGSMNPPPNRGSAERS